MKKEKENYRKKKAFFHIKSFVCKGTKNVIKNNHLGAEDSDVDSSCKCSFMLYIG